MKTVIFGQIQLFFLFIVPMQTTNRDVKFIRTLNLCDSSITTPCSLIFQTFLNNDWEQSNVELTY